MSLPVPPLRDNGAGPIRDGGDGGSSLTCGDGKTWDGAAPANDGVAARGNTWRAAQNEGTAMATSAHRELAALLEELKERSGNSYQQIGKKSHLSKSTVHRICVGQRLPSEYAVIERIGQACRASPQELFELHRRWVDAYARSGDERSASAERATAARGADAAGEPPATELPPAPRWRRRRTTQRAAGLILVVALVGWVAAGSLPQARVASLAAPARQPQVVYGPSWTQTPRILPGTLFGVTMNSATGAMPTFRVGAVRLWDSRTRWANIQPQRGEFDWATLDRHVNGADEAGLPVLFTIGGTPQWAAPNGVRSVYNDGSRAAPPDNLADWDAFVGAVAERYGDRIEAYELWVLGSDKRFYAGSVERLVEMTRRAARIVKARAPGATVVCPGMGRLWTAAGQQFLRRFAELGGYQECDVASIKLHARSAADPPETMLQLVETIGQTLHRAGVHPPLWNTGTTYELPLEGSLDEATAINHAVRFYLVGVYSRRADVARMYFYNWGGSKLPIVLQAEGGAPTAAALAVEELQRWLHRARLRSCGHGRAIRLPENVWQCEFEVSDSGRTFDAAITWTDTGSAAVTAGPGDNAVHRLDGTTSIVPTGDTVQITEEPIFIERLPRGRDQAQ